MSSTTANTTATNDVAFTNLEEGRPATEQQAEAPITGYPAANLKRKRNLIIGGTALLLVCIGVGTFFALRPASAPAAAATVTITDVNEAPATVSPPEQPPATTTPTVIPPVVVEAPPASGPSKKPCKNDFHCPANSQRLPHRKCYDSIHDCKCNHGYTMNKHKGRCEKTCKNDFHCPANSMRKPHRKCYDSIDDCACKHGFEMVLGRGAAHGTGACIKPTPVHRPTICCHALEAKCESCKAGQSVEQFCKAKPFFAGCPRPHAPALCCQAVTAECESCKAGQSVFEFCLANGKTFPGCGGRPAF